MSATMLPKLPPISSTLLPYRLESTPNLRLNRWDKARLVKAQRGLAMAVPWAPLPVTVILTRIAPRALDDDNLQGAFKAIRDGIADKLGVADNHPGLTFLYAQERGKPREYAVRITLQPRPAP